MFQVLSGHLKSLVSQGIWGDLRLFGGLKVIRIVILRWFEFIVGQSEVIVGRLGSNRKSKPLEIGG